MLMNDKLEKIEGAIARLAAQETRCTLCPRKCGIDRSRSEKGICRSGTQASLSHALLHYGEEPVLSGHEDCRQSGPKANLRSGSGTIFFTGCNLKCLFCQNYQLSWLGEGRAVEDSELARIMIGLQEKGALNINLVSPTHLIVPILRALKIAYAEGLRLPLVYNSNGYERAEIIRQLEGIVDIYLPDLKYFSPQVAEKYSAAADYFSHASRAIREMARQKPELILDEKEIALRGLIIRHLILPGNGEDSLAILSWIRKNISAAVTLSLMSQYHPSFRAPEDIRRPLSSPEYQAVLDKAEELGFESLFVQPPSFDPGEHLVPDFRLNDPFPWK
jgi:putative pyruvate formate lyase activating enzyme